MPAAAHLERSGSQHQRRDVEEAAGPALLCLLCLLRQVVSQLAQREPRAVLLGYHINGVHLRVQGDAQGCGWDRGQAL